MQAPLLITYVRLPQMPHIWYVCVPWFQLNSADRSLQNEADVYEPNYQGMHVYGLLASLPKNLVINQLSLSSFILGRTLPWVTAHQTEIVCDFFFPELILSYSKCAYSDPDQLLDCWHCGTFRFETRFRTTPATNLPLFSPVGWNPKSTRYSCYL